MNIRKLFSIYGIVFYIISIFILMTKPEKVFEILTKLIIIFGLVELIYFSYEYYTLIKPKKAYYIVTRSKFMFKELIIYVPLIIMTVILGYSNYESIFDDREYTFFFGIVSSLKGGIFRKLKGSPIMDNYKLSFNSLLEKDIYIADIKRIYTNEDKKNLIIELNNNELVIIKVEYEFFDDNLDKLNQLDRIIKKSN